MDDPGPNFILAQAIELSQNSAGGSLVLKILLLLALILVNAYFAMAEIAVISLNDTKMEKLAEEGHKKAKLVLKLTKNPTKFLSTIQIGITLAGFLTSASAATSFAEMLTDAVTGKFGLPENIVSPVAVVLITLIMSYFSLVLGELVPKRIGMQIPEKVAFAVAKPLYVIAKLTSPFVKFLSLSTNGVVRLLGFDPNADEEVVTEEEIRMMVDVGGEKGVIEDAQKEMINNIFGSKVPKNVIYCIQNIETGKKYIGKTSAEVSKRWTEHVKTSLGIGGVKKSKIHSMLFNNWDKFTFSVIEVVENANLSEREKYYINFFETDKYGYNIKSGG